MMRRDIDLRRLVRRAQAKAEARARRPFQRFAHAQAMLKKAQRRRKLATTIERRWSRRVARLTKALAARAGTL